jgi:hypothetical protein
MTNDNRPEEPKGVPGGPLIRGAINTFSGLIPVFGSVISAAAGAWGEREQEKINQFLKQWVKMLEDEIREKAQTVLEVMSRLDMHDEEIARRISSDEYQSILRKGFREWSAAESESKRVLFRNILANAAATKVVSDDVVRLFLDWLKHYSEIHFAVAGRVYNNTGITRAGIWKALGKEPVREDSADADLFRLLIRDLSTGGLIRQHRETDYHGNFLKKPARRSQGQGTSSTAKSSFDDQDSYELTELGTQFVHYAMTDLPPKISFDAAAAADAATSTVETQSA